MTIKRLTKQQLAGVQSVATKYYGVVLTDKQARQIANADCLDNEIGYNGPTDTASRDYLIMAIIDKIMPDKPDLVDELLGETELKHWHWPVNGSSGAYTMEFYKKFKEAAKEHGFELVPKFPG